MKTIVGTRIRERRRQIGETQARLAERMGISASYLNLIERNKRRIAGPLLRRAADALELQIEDLDGAAERRLVETLGEIAQFPTLAPLEIEAEMAGELIGRFPGWARAMAALARSEYDAKETARALSDRLIHDPFLGETVHRMLSRIASVRSAAEILSDYADIPPDQRDRFHQIVLEESNGLTEVGEALAAYFDRLDQPTSSLTPTDEVEALFEAHANRFAPIEEAAAAMPAPVGEAADDLTTSALDPAIHALLDQTPHIRTEAARGRALTALRAYAASALRMPMERFAEIAAAERYDVERIVGAFGVGVASVCQRLTALPQNDQTPRFGYLRANAAGTLIRMLGLPGLNLPRYAAACPLWVLYRAQQVPGAAMRQFALFPSGGRFIFVARARATGAAGFGQPRHYVTDMLAMSAADAALTVYDPGTVEPEEVGPACRICPRETCRHRVADPFTG